LYVPLGKEDRNFSQGRREDKFYAVPEERNQLIRERMVEHGNAGIVFAGPSHSEGVRISRSLECKGVSRGKKGREG